MTEREFGELATEEILSALAHDRERTCSRYEGEFTESFIRDIAACTTFVDCGAEYGYYVGLALKYGPRGIAIHAFEPEPARCAALNNTFAYDPNVRVYETALADKPTSTVALKPGVGISMSLVGALHSDGDRIRVQTACLDDMVKSVDLLKIDVEGAEDRVLRGATRLIHDCRPTLYLELHGEDALSLWALRFLESLDYPTPTWPRCVLRRPL